MKKQSHKDKITAQESSTNQGSVSKSRIAKVVAVSKYDQKKSTSYFTDYQEAKAYYRAMIDLDGKGKVSLNTYTLYVKWGRCWCEDFFANGDADYEFVRAFLTTKTYIDDTIKSAVKKGANEAYIWGFYGPWGHYTDKYYVSYMEERGFDKETLFNFLMEWTEEEFENETDGFMRLEYYYICDILGLEYEEGYDTDDIHGFSIYPEYLSKEARRIVGLKD